MITFFAAVTYGEPWKKLAQPLEAISSRPDSVVISFIFLTLFGLVNTVNAIYVDALMNRSMVDRAASERSASDRGVLKELRSGLLSKPINERGEIKRKHLNQVLAGPGAPLLAKLRLDPHIVRSLVTLLDADDDNCVEVDEFLSGLLHLKGNAADIQTSKRKGFQAFCRHGSDRPARSPSKSRF